MIYGRDVIYDIDKLQKLYRENGAKEARCFYTINCEPADRFYYYKDRRALVSCGHCLSGAVETLPTTLPHISLPGDDRLYSLLALRPVKLLIIGMTR